MDTLSSPAPALRPEGLLRAWDGSVVELTNDERELLGLLDRLDSDPGRLVAQTQLEYLGGAPEARGEKQRRYVAALNLAAKLNRLSDQEKSPKDEERRQQYFRMVADTRLTEVERAAIKQSIWFSDGGSP